jgi:hypothetical protein
MSDANRQEPILDHNRKRGGFRGVRIGLVALTLIVAAGCLELRDVSSTEVRLNRVYQLQDCSSTGSGGLSSANGCAWIVGGHASEVIDSSRLVLNERGDAVWTTWGTYTFNPCSPGVCHTPTKRTRAMGGTYALEANGIRVRMVSSEGSDALLFFATIPARVDRAWLGPDTLKVLNPFPDGSGGFRQTMRFR